MRKADLFRPHPPWIVLDQWQEGNNSRVLLPSARYDEPKGAAIRKLRGHKMHGVPELMEEFGAALQFFDDFGENWHALKE